jgi:hypothetical protein
VAGVQDVLVTGGQRCDVQREEKGNELDFFHDPGR